MGKPAAVLGSFHSCPAKTSRVPHVGGPALASSPDVFVGGMPVACLGDALICVGPPDSIAAGSASVTANGKPIARVGDATSHGGKLVAGNPTVLVGG